MEAEVGDVAGSVCRAVRSVEVRSVEVAVGTRSSGTTKDDGGI